MRTNLSMVDDALIRLVNKFYRILNGKNMVFSGSICLIYDGSQGGRFAVAGGAGNQHQSLGKMGQPGDNLRQSKLLDTENVRGDLSENRSYPIFLIEEVTAVAGQTGYLIIEVYVSGFLTNFNFCFRAYILEHGVEFILCHHFELDSLHITAYSQHGLLISDHM